MFSDYKLLPLCWQRLEDVEVKDDYAKSSYAY